MRRKQQPPSLCCRCASAQRSTPCRSQTCWPGVMQRSSRRRQLGTAGWLPTQTDPRQKTCRSEQRLHGSQWGILCPAGAATATTINCASISTNCLLRGLLPPSALLLHSTPPLFSVQTELSWLLDDALAALARPGADWRPATWQQVERDLRRGGPLAEAACQYMVQLREPLEALGETCWEGLIG